MQRWGIGETIPIDLPGAAASTVGDFDDIADNLPLLAIRGFGQNDDQMVPLHMAMVAATVANGGAMMKPYVVDAELDHDGNVLNRTQPEVWKPPISAETADILRDLMVGVAERGTASCCIALENGIQRRRQDRNRPAQRPPASRSGRTPGSSAFAPAEAPEVRRGGDAQGHQRRDLGQHRRPAGRPDRQGDARRHVRASTRPSPRRHRRPPAPLTDPPPSRSTADHDDRRSSRRRVTRDGDAGDADCRRRVDSLGQRSAVDIAAPTGEAAEP